MFHQVFFALDAGASNMHSHAGALILTRETLQHSREVIVSNWSTISAIQRLLFKKKLKLKAENPAYFKPDSFKPGHFKLEQLEPRLLLSGDPISETANSFFTILTDHYQYKT
jgi:hypothetical protein